MAVAYLTLTDVGAETQNKLRDNEYCQQQPHRNAERRKVFRP